MYQILFAAGGFALAPAGSFVFSRRLPVARFAMFLTGWKWGASSGFIAVTACALITGYWLPVAAYAASLLLCDLTTVIALEIAKRTCIRFQQRASKRYYLLDSPEWPQDRRRSH